jgi:hypothetical protein
VGLLLFAVLVIAPYLAGRGLWRVRMPLTIRIAVVLAVAAVLVWWLATTPGFADITSPSAALFPLSVIVGWLLGTSTALRRTLAAAARHSQH